jgi:hypothetical protein
MNRSAPALLIAEIVLTQMWLSGICMVACCPLRA